MKSYVTELESQQESSWKIVKSASLIFLFPAIVSICWASGIDPIVPSANSLSLAGVAGILAGTYFYASRFFKQDFYFFIFLGWFANALYLIPERSRHGGEPPHFQWGVLGLSFLATLLLAPALFTPRARKEAKRWFYFMLSVVTGIAGLIATIVLLRSMKPAGISPLGWTTIFTSFLSFCLIWIIGEDLRLRLDGETEKWKLHLGCYTYRVYAALQFFYPFVVLGQIQQSTTDMLFSIAQLVKVGNAISILGIIQSAVVNRELMQNQLNYRELELKAKQADLQVASEKINAKTQLVELGMLASAIKHDVNTPLATMGFDIQSLKDRYQHDTKITRKLRNLEEAMDRVHAIVKVVDIFRGDQAFFDREEYMSKSNMLEIAHRAVRSVKNEKESLKKHDPRDIIKIEGKDVYVRAYGPMFEQVIVNVVKNGLEAIDEAKRERGLITITVGTTELEESEYSRWVRVEIEDNGAGIPPENIPRLTTLFTTRADKKPNSGIGLFIGKKIVDIHHGRMVFESVLGKGTKVTLLLPEWRALVKSEQASETESEDMNSTDENSALRVNQPDVKVSQAIGKVAQGEGA